ncbi:Serine/threonine protein kinase [Phytophthora cinnamomi]|uniref:Serine/threonine protein kinase n=1 Tax=Phytophthora cinnamomi TaxID=4785 RepID=UPI00355A716B|nr:Serine/threonine protein kinase [Phytophthora cinnamomi]
MVTSTQAPPAPLLAVALLFRAKPQFAGIDHVVHAVSAFADSSVELPLAAASRFGSEALLERIWNSSVDLEPGGRSLWSVRRLLREYPLYNKLQFTLSLLAVVKANSVEVVR